jgi:methylase of polypeptide subunit release factors
MSISILDLAAGSGVWGIVLAEQFPQARVTAVDFAAVLEVTKETTEKHGVSDSKQTVFKLSSPKSSGISGVAEEFRCHSLHRSQISQDL